MATEQLSGGSASNNGQSFTWVVDYDTVAQTVGLTCTGGGHALLRVVRASDNTELNAVNADQFGQTSGTVKQTESIDPVTQIGLEDAGQSTADDVTYDGTRHIVDGPGAVGIDAHGVALPTRKVSSTVVGVINPPKGTQPTLYIQLVQHFSLRPLA